MELDRYRNLLSTVASQLSEIGDRNGERLFLRWLRELDQPVDAEHSNFRLEKHVVQVRRSAQAISILAIERYISPSTPGGTRQTRIEGAISDLLREAARLEAWLNRVQSIVADEGLPGIVNEYLSSVEFVMDYVQLRFSGATLTAFTWPEVQEEKTLYRVNGCGYRDALCRRIGIVVRSASVRDGEEILINFTDSASISVSLRPEDRSGPESAMFDSASGRWWVW